MLSSVVSAIAYFLGLIAHGLPAAPYAIGQLVGALATPFILFFIGRASFNAGQSRLDNLAQQGAQQDVAVS
jgi:hypothetical protein